LSMKIFNYFVLLLLFFSFVFAGDIDENELFSDTNIIGEVKNLSESEKEKEGFGLSGRLASSLGYNFHRKYLENKIGSESNSFSFGMEGDLFFDVRLKKGYKVFCDLWVASDYQGNPQYKNLYNPLNGTSETLIETNSMVLKMKELFLDYNLNHIAYLRFGKQFLKWGVTYFWNPVDLINREKKSFTDLEATREGSWGIKLHIPYKTVFNFYSFVDFTDVKKIEDSALATKLEFVLGNTEIGFSGWFKKEFYSVYGIDLSTRILGFDVKAESSFSYGDNRRYIKDFFSGVPTERKITNELVYRVALNIYKAFEFLDKKDRITTMVEIFYNSAGYTNNIFEDEAKINYFIYNGLYYPNEYGKLYAFFMLGYKDLFISDLNFSLNYLCNFTQYSSMLGLLVSYSPIDEVSTTFATYINIGEEKREYTYTEIPLSMTLGVEMKF